MAYFFSFVLFLVVTLVFVIIVTCFVAVVAALFALIFSKTENRENNSINAVISSVAFGVVFGVGVLVTHLLACRTTDLGFGDTRFLKFNGCSIESVDGDPFHFIDAKGHHIGTLSDVAMTADLFYAKQENGKTFFYKFEDGSVVRDIPEVEMPVLQKVEDFYISQVSDITSSQRSLGSLITVCLAVLMGGFCFRSLNRKDGGLVGRFRNNALVRKLFD